MMMGKLTASFSSVARAPRPCALMHGRGARATVLTCGALLIVVISVSSVAGAGDNRDASMSITRDVIERYVNDLGALERRENLPGSQAAHDRLVQFDRDELAGLRALDFDSLDQAGRIDYLLLQNKLTFDQKQLDRRRRQFDEAAELLPF